MITGCKGQTGPSCHGLQRDVEQLWREGLTSCVLTHKIHSSAGEEMTSSKSKHIRPPCCISQPVCREVKRAPYLRTAPSSCHELALCRRRAVWEFTVRSAYFVQEVTAPNNDHSNFMPRLTKACHVYISTFIKPVSKWSASRSKSKQIAKCVKWIKLSL